MCTSNHPFQYLVNIQPPVSDIPLQLVLTKCDLACKHVAVHLSNTFRSRTITDLVDTAALLFSLPRNSIFPLKNYEHETSLVHNIGTLALNTFQSLVYAAESYIEDQASSRAGDSLQKLRSVSNVSSGSHGRTRSASDVTGSPVFRRCNSEIALSRGGGGVGRSLDQGEGRPY